jgi:hypothetical protein
MNGLDLIQSWAEFPRGGINQASGYCTPNDYVRQTVHPDLLYIMAQQHGEQLRRQAEHARLSRQMPRKTMGSSALLVWHWFGFSPANR